MEYKFTSLSDIQNAIGELFIRMDAMERQSANIMLHLEFLERVNQYGPTYGFMMSPQLIRPYHSRLSPSLTPRSSRSSLVTNSVDYSIPARALTPSSLSNSNRSFTPANNPHHQ